MPTVAQEEIVARPRAARPKMLWDLSSLALGQFLSVVLGFAGFAYLARSLSPESYGLVEYAVGLAGLAAMVIDGGVGSVGTLHVSRARERAPALAATVPTARLLIAAAVVPLVGLSSLASGFDGTAAVLVWCFALSLLAVPLRQDWLLQGLDRMTLVPPAQVLKSGVFAVAVVLIVRGDAQVSLVGVAEIVAAFASAVSLLAAQRYVSIPIRLDAQLSGAWALLRDGASIGASNMLWPFMTYAPILLLTNLVGTTDAAWLGAAHRIVVALVSFSALYFFNLYPLLGRGLQEDRDRWQRLIFSSFRLIAWASIGFALATSLTAGPILTTVFGRPYAAAAPALAIAIWILPLRLLSGHARWSLLAAERQNVLLVAEIACAASIVLFGVLLVPRYAAAGGALAGVLGNLVGWTLAHFLAERHVGSLPGWRQLLLPSSGAALAAAVVWSVHAPALFAVPAALTIYAVCLWLTASDLFSDAIRLAHAKRGVMDNGEA